MHANHKKRSWFFSNKLYIFLLFAIVLLFLMIPAVSFATNFADGQNDNSLVEDIQNNEDKSSIFTNPVAEQNNINNFGNELNYLCFSPHTAGQEVKIVISKYRSDTSTPYERDIKYSYNCETWNTLNFSEEVAGLSTCELTFSEPIYFKGNNPNGLNIAEQSGDEFIPKAMYNFSDVFLLHENEDNLIDSSGSVMSLIYADDSSKTDIPSDFCFASLFNSFEALVSPPELPSTKLTVGCYANMFTECFNLTSAPELPAESLCDYCYQGMFSECTCLESMPSLPAETLEDYCYRNMFSECDTLTSTVYLPAPLLVKGCYESMFYDCQKLSEVQVGFTAWNDEESSTSNWLDRVSSSSESKFLCFKDVLDITKRDESHIPIGWQVDDLPLPVCKADVESYLGNYDATEHTISVSNVTPAGASVTYSLDGEIFSTDPINILDVGICTVYVKVSMDGYQDYSCSATITIQPTTGTIVSVGSKDKYYGETDPVFDVSFEGIGDVVPILGHDYVISRESGESVKASGSYVVNLYLISNNLIMDSVIPGSLTIKKANDLKLVANPASKVEGDVDPTFTAHMEGLKFNDSFDPTDYNYYKINKVTESNDTITLQPELTDAGKAYYGQNYDVTVTGFAQASTLTVYTAAGEQAFTYTTNAFNINYNGQENEFKVNVNNPPSGLIVEYKTSQEGSYSQTPPKFKDADTYMVYFKISATGYSTVETSQQVKINPAPATLVADYSCIYKNVGDPDPELNATLFGAVNGESLVKGTDYNISRIAGEDAGSYDLNLSAVSGTDKTKNYQIQVAPSKFFILGSGDVPPVPPTPPTPPTPDDPGTNPSFVNSIIAQTGDDNLAIVISLIVVACACGGFITYRKLRKK